MGFGSWGFKSPLRHKENGSITTKSPFSYLSSFPAVFERFAEFCGMDAEWRSSAELLSSKDVVKRRPERGRVRMSNWTVEEEEMVRLLDEEFGGKITVEFTDPSPGAIFEDLNLSTLDLVRADCARLAVTDEDFAALCEHPLAGGALGSLFERYLEWLTGGHGALFEVADGSERSRMFLESRA